MVKCFPVSKALPSQPGRAAVAGYHVTLSSAALNADFTSSGVTWHSMIAAIAIMTKITRPIFLIWPRIKRQISPG